MPATDAGVLLEVLRLCVALPGDARAGQTLRGVTRSVWQDVPAAAEAHGVAPLVYRHLIDAGVMPPADTRQLLFGLASAHRVANEVRFGALTNVLDAFDAASIRVLILKGAALAHILYPSPALRPCGDIDVLVEPRDAWRAQATLARLGFDAPLESTDHRFVDHHHLPPATRCEDGQWLQIEIHTDALSRDAPGSLVLEDCWDQRQAFEIGGRTAFAFGHLDMLHHLARHAAQPASLFRMIWSVDIVRYAARFHAEIDWPALQRHCPFVLNALGLLHLVTPLPSSVLGLVPVPAESMSGAGSSCRPLNEIIRPRSASAVLAELLVPNEWWLRLYYGAGSLQAVRWFRWVGHPARVVWWLVRRSAGRLLRWRFTTRLASRHG